MNKAFRLMLCLFLIIGWSSCTWLRVEAQSGVVNSDRSIGLDFEKLPQLPQLPELSVPLVGGLTFLPLPTFQDDLLQPPFEFSDDIVAMLQSAILSRLGIRYRYRGVDDRGYDCSGFVWRVYRDAGAEFQRVAARTLWRQLPAAKGDETKQFGTLVFFNGLKHIGIVRDAESFYHSSRSQGIVLSQYAGYWNKRVKGFRRSPMPIIPIPPDTP